MPDPSKAMLEHFTALHKIGAALSRESDTGFLLASILDAARRLTGADGGTLYRVTDDGTALRFEIVRCDTLVIASDEEGMPLPDLPLRGPDGRPNDSSIAVHAAVHDRTVNLADVYEPTGFDFSAARAFDARTGYRSKSFLTVPMRNQEGQLLGVLQLINAIDADTGEVRAFTQHEQHLAESLASQAAIALNNRLLITQLEQLFESFVNLINLAIDEKSPYTGGHCQRVPELTMMLADAAHAAQQGPLASFSMSERERYELKIAGLLHDCGKVTTPVHVVDKATKLQTIYDRMGLVETRFEVLKRDAEIAALRAQLALRSPVDAGAETRVQQQLQQTLEGIAQDCQFLRQANQGAESMRLEDQQRVHDIAAARQWTTPQGEYTSALTDNEVENLTVRKGTLTADERATINHHIVATIKMLETLPWPQHLKNVPEYAGGHHERMDGKGYPRGLTRSQMSWQARMLGVADIFESLTAADRPYKSGMPLSQALLTMRRMRDNGHIDPDLFDLFVRSGVYQRYAERFLPPEQCDPVDLSALGLLD
jgi:HD-GYP domain-containing protein (c-di-GMP phosphodiesterase class II)